MSQKLPNPPSNFGVAAVTHTISPGTRLWRIYFRGGSHQVTWSDFRFYGPTSSRFDHHKPPGQIQKRGILYATAKSKATLSAFAEVYQDTRVIDRFHNTPWLAAFELTDSLSMLDTKSIWTVRAKGNMAINSGSRVQSRKWARQIYRQYPDVHGIWYPSSITNHPCSAIFERGDFALPTRAVFNRALSDPSLLPGITHIAANLNYSVK